MTAGPTGTAEEGPSDSAAGPAAPVTGSAPVDAAYGVYERGARGRLRHDLAHRQPHAEPCGEALRPSLRSGSTPLTNWAFP